MTRADRRIIVALALAVTLLPVLVMAAVPTRELPRASAHTAAVCHEDAPCWNWYRMGNHRRGWTGPWGSPHSGGACRFARAVARHHVFRYRRTQVMRGDHDALRAAVLAGCVSRHSIAKALA